MDVIITVAVVALVLAWFKTLGRIVLRAYDKTEG
jgi:hypothetical protein